MKLRILLPVFACFFVLASAQAQTNFSFAVEAVGGGSTKGYGPQYAVGAESYALMSFPCGLGFGLGTGLEYYNAVFSVTNYDTRNYYGQILAPVYCRLQYDSKHHVYAAVNAGYAICMKMYDGLYSASEIQECMKPSDGLFVEPQIGFVLGNHLMLAFGLKAQKCTAAYDECGEFPTGYLEILRYYDQQIGHSLHLHIGYKF